VNRTEPCAVSTTIEPFTFEMSVVGSKEPVGATSGSGGSGATGWALTAAVDAWARSGVHATKVATPTRAAVRMRPACRNEPSSRCG